MTESNTPFARALEMAAGPHVRANRNGDPCPGWCTQDHDEALIPGKPEFGFMNHHWSDALIGDAEPRVKLTRRAAPDAEPEICLTSLTGLLPILLPVEKAHRLAALLVLAYGQQDLLADQLHTAVAIIRDMT